MGAPRTRARVLHFVGWAAWLVVHEHWRAYLLPMLGRAGLDMRPFADARWVAVRQHRATEGDLRQLANQAATELKPVSRAALMGAFGEAGLAAVVVECRRAAI
eukprot:557923-Alexandrium_andersonii.AAC.1